MTKFLLLDHTLHGQPLLSGLTSVMCPVTRDPRADAVTRLHVTLVLVLAS